MQAYLFVHFREKTTPDGEQVYFGVSKDGFNWEEVNGGAPVLWAYYGDKGVRDFTVVRCKNPQTGKEKFVILATDLSLSYGMRGQYHHSWDEIGHNGSKSLAIWESDDLVNWTEQRLAKIGDEQEGKNLEPGKKSYAVSFLLQDESQTLNDKMIDKIMSKLVKNLEDKLGAKLR